MLHRKAIHNAVCRLSLTNQCERDQETCWFNHPPHKNTVPAKYVKSNGNPENTANSNQKDFQENPPVEAPSLAAPEISQMMDQMMTVMKSEMTKMFQSMMNHRQTQENQA